MRIIAILALLLVTAVAVSWAAKVDIVAPTRGEVVARQRTRAVQALESGVVAALHVDEGERVRAGALLVELDDTIVASEIRRLHAQLREAQGAADRLRLVQAPSVGAGTEGGAGARTGTGADAAGGAGARTGAGAGAGLEAEAGAGGGAAAGGTVPAYHRSGGPYPHGEPPRAGRARHERLADLERRRLAATLAEAAGRLEAGRMRFAAVAAERRLVERLLPVVREQEEGLAALSARSHASRHEYLRELSRRIELEGRAESLAIDLQREEREIARLQTVGRLLRLEQDAVWQRELVEVEARIEQLREDLVQARRRHRQHRIDAPIDGVVQDVGELVAGSFVERGDRLMAVVPADGGLEIRAYVRNRDVGFVRAGQDAIVKIDAFPFTRYGTAEGVVEGVSLDAVGGGAPPSGEGAEEFSAGYLARVSLLRPAIEIDGAVVPLRPGMQAVVDVRTGRRRMLEYVIAPLVAYGSNAFRER